VFIYYTMCEAISCLPYIRFLTQKKGKKENKYFLFISSKAKSTCVKTVGANCSKHRFKHCVGPRTKKSTALGC
jgi:hypothetical protein